MSVGNEHTPIGEVLCPLEVNMHQISVQFTLISRSALFISIITWFSEQIYRRPHTAQLRARLSASTGRLPTVRKNHDIGIPSWPGEPR